MSEITVCQTKVHYDTEFAADRAAAIFEHKYKEELMSYPCGRHFHLTHKNPDHRRGAGKQFIKCRDCGELVKRSKIKNHVCVTGEDFT